MKSCPTCNRTYPDDTLAFCLMDGSVLSAPYDPSETRAAPVRSSEPPPTVVILAPAKSAEPRAPLQSTIRAPGPQFPDLHRAKTPAIPSEKVISVPLVFRLALGVRGIVAVFSIIPWILLSGWGRPWHMHAIFAACASLVAGSSLIKRHRRGVFLLVDGIVAVIVFAGFSVSSQWRYWTNTWPIVSGTLLIAAAIELRKHLSRTWLLALAGLIFGLYTVIFYIVLNVSYTEYLIEAAMYSHAGTALTYGLILVVFAILARGKGVSHAN